MALSFMSQNSADHLLKVKILRPHLREADSVAMRVAGNLDLFFFFFFNPGQLHHPLWAILMYLIQEPFLEHRIA